MAEKVEVYQGEFESGKVAAIAEGVGTWRRKSVAVRARLMKRPFVLHTPVGVFYGAAGWWLVEEGDVLTVEMPEVFAADFEYDGPAGEEGGG